MGELQLSEAELYIMQWFWQRGAMKTDELSALVAPREWKPTTLLTFLSRLAAKGMLQVERQGKSNLYSPLVTETHWRASESRSFLNEMHGGSARNFLAAMTDAHGLSREDISELKAWLDEQEV